MPKITDYDFAFAAGHVADDIRGAMEELPKADALSKHPIRTNIARVLAVPSALKAVIYLMKSELFPGNGNAATDPVAGAKAGLAMARITERELGIVLREVPVADIAVAVDPHFIRQHFVAEARVFSMPNIAHVLEAAIKLKPDAAQAHANLSSISRRLWGPK